MSIRSPNEIYIRYLISRQHLDSLQRLEMEEDEDQEIEWLKPKIILSHLLSLRLDGVDEDYIRLVASEMCPMPIPFKPIEDKHTISRKFLKKFKIYDLWHQTAAVREAQLILTDLFLREKLEPLLLSSMTHRNIAKKLRRHTSIVLTAEGVDAYAHYFWNRNMLTQYEWMSYLNKPYRNVYKQSLTASPDLVSRHLPWVIGIDGPAQNFSSADAAARIGQIALKHALELEHVPASHETSNALKNYMVTIEKADQIMRRSDMALRDVLAQFKKFRMKVNSAKIVDAKQLTGGNYSKSGEGTDIKDDDF